MYIYIFIALLIFISNFIPIIVKPEYPIDVNSIKYKKLKQKRLKSSEFPNPYPNSWYYVCDSNSIKKNCLKEFHILDLHLVVFRDNDENIGIIDLYCPHLGTNLAEGGKIVNNCIQCPYHKWSFNKNGICKDIPYTKKDIPERANTKKYYSYEQNDMIFIWYNSDNEIPYINDKLINIELFKHLDDKHKFIMSKIYEDFHMHIMEPSQNSADWYHFKTVHDYLPNPFFKYFLKIDHNIHPLYTDNSSDINITNKKKYISNDIIIIKEEIISSKIFNLIPVPNFINKLFTVHVIIETPSLILFSIDNSLGQFRAIMTLTPIEPFIQKINLTSYGSGIFIILGRIMTYFVMKTVEQDRRVWENKMHISPRNIVSGDGPFASYKNWLDKFYTSNSKKNIDLNW